MRSGLLRSRISDGKPVPTFPENALIRAHLDQGQGMTGTSGERIGIVGVGRMGLAMAKRLLHQGYRVAACDLDKKQCDAARAAGAVIVGAPAELGKLARFVIIGVGYDEEVQAVMLGEHGLLDALEAGSIIAISSTCTPENVKALDARARGKKGDVLDAPICLGARAANEGTLLALVGGKPDVFERARPIYRTFCSDV